MAVASICKIIVILFFFQLSDPQTVTTTIVFMALEAFHTMQSLFNDALIMRNTPKDIRGTMMGIYQFVGAVGSMAFTKIGASMYNSYGPSAPFLFVMILDSLLVVILIILGISKRFND